jgi:hypothetical protein
LFDKPRPPAVASAGCQSDVPDPQPGTRSTSDVFETIREVALQEPEGLPITGIDDFAVLSDGRFVVVDSKSGQIRLHGRRGDLIRIASARGEGPGEFRRPLRVAAVAAGGFVASGAEPALSVFDSAGVFMRDLHFERDLGISALGAQDMTSVDSSSVLFAASDGTYGT